MAKGYLNRPKETKKRFISHYLGPRLNATGDLVRREVDRKFEFVGRTDTQVKIRGFRVEPGEIEAALSQHPGVWESVVTAREDVPGSRRLVAYIVPIHQSAPAISNLRSFLSQKLPDYMVPSAFVSLDALPLTSNGKVDHTSLPAPDLLRPNLTETLVLPRNEKELQLTKIWESVLDTHPIGVKDNFFELGGHSLLAVSLFTKIEKMFGSNLPLATLFQAPTVEQLAELLIQEGWSPPWSSLVAVQPNGSKPPFFLVHGGGGHVLHCYELAVHLDAEQPLYGLQAQGLDGRKPPYTRIEDMARHYINEMRSLFPEGPYFLGGRSGGGVVAFEMGQQLIRDGHEVPLLILFDTGRPDRRHSQQVFRAS